MNILKTISNFFSAKKSKAVEPVIMSLEDALSKGTVKITAYKVKELRRLAVGLEAETTERYATRKSELIEKLGLEPKTDEHTQDHLLPFIDLEKEEWRCFCYKGIVSAVYLENPNIQLFW
jgi:hypothetical protein